MISRLVIIEGPDGAGKSCLAQRLLDTFQAYGRKAAVVHHHAYPGEECISVNFYASIVAALKDEHFTVIMDRCWLSEPIYNVAFNRGHCRVTEDEAEILATIVDRLDGRLIVALPDYEVCLKNRPEDASFLRSAYHGYTNGVLLGPSTQDWSMMPTPAIYDYTDETSFTRMCGFVGLR